MTVRLSDQISFQNRLTYHRGGTNELGVAKESGSTVVVAVQESYFKMSASREDDTTRDRGVVLSGFFLTTRKTVSRSSANLVR